MFLILKLMFWFAVFIAAFHFLTKKYINPYRLTMIFGKKGSGKSTLMVSWPINIFLAVGAFTVLNVWMGVILLIIVILDSLTSLPILFY